MFTAQQELGCCRLPVVAAPIAIRARSPQMRDSKGTISHLADEESIAQINATRSDRWPCNNWGSPAMALSFIANQPVEESGLRLDRGEIGNHTIEYGIPRDVTERPSGHLHDLP
ncbi:hypothetical protein GCM10009856_32550 [Mycolicibacterium llatzerense]